MPTLCAEWVFMAQFYDQHHDERVTLGESSVVFGSSFLFRASLWCSEVVCYRSGTMFGPILIRKFGGKLTIPKIISMGSNESEGLNHIISIGPGCVLIISDDTCDF